MLRALSKPIRTVLRWQILATAFAVALLGALAGTHGAVSAALGGAISIVAGLAAAWWATRRPAQDATAMLAGALGAEALKIGLIISLLVAVFVLYRNVVAAGFIATFAVTTVLFSMALFVRES